jgi:hypothetical protein
LLPQNCNSFSLEVVCNENVLSVVKTISKLSIR